MRDYVIMYFSINLNILECKVYLPLESLERPPVLI